MTFDTTGPVRINETHSLVLMLVLIGLVAGGIWLALDLNQPAKPPPASADPAVAPPVPAAPEPEVRQTPPRILRRRPAPTQRPPDMAPAGLSHPSENILLVRAGTTYATFTTNPTNKNIDVSRSHPRDEKGTLWITVNAAMRIAHQPKVAAHYEATPDQIAALEALHLSYPQLSRAQQKTLRDLFNAMQEATPENRPAAEKALIQAVASMPIPPNEQKNFEAAVAKVRAILRPDQLDLIDNNL